MLADEQRDGALEQIAALLLGPEAIDHGGDQADGSGQQNLRGRENEPAFEQQVSSRDDSLPTSSTINTAARDGGAET